MLKTGEICTESAFYKCNVHGESLIFIKKDDKAPECSYGPYGSHMTLWGPTRKVSKIVSELKTNQMHSAEPSSLS